MNDVLNNKKKSEVLAEKIKEMKYGDIIYHSEIEQIIEEKHGSNKYGYTIKKAKGVLEKDGIFLESISGDGYRIVEPDDSIQHSLKHYKRGFNAMQKGFNTLKNAPVKDMTPEGRDIHRRVYDRSVILAASMKGASVELKTLGEKNHPMGLNNIKK